MLEKITGKEYKSLLSNFFSLTSLQIVTYILPLLTFPYLVRTLGVEKFGLVAFAQSIMVFFLLFIDYGFDLSATKEISQNRENKEKLTEIFSSVLIIKIIFNLISILLLGCLVIFYQKFHQDYDIYFISFIFVIGQSLFPTWYFQGMESMKNIAFINIISKMLFTIFIFVFVSNESDYLLVPLLNGIGSLIGTLYSFYIIRIKFKQKIKYQNFNTLVRYLKHSSQYFLSRVSISLFTSINVTILGLTTNNTIVGYYSIAEKLYQSMQRAYSPVTQVLYPFVSRVQDSSLVRKAIYSLLPLNVFALAIIYVFDYEIFNFFFKQETSNESLTVFHIFLISIIITLPSSIIGYPLLGALGFAKQVNFGIIFASIIHILGLYILFLIDKITIYNVASMVVITESIILFSRIFYIYKNHLWFYKGIKE